MTRERSRATRPGPRRAGDDHQDAGGDREIESEIDDALGPPALLADARHHAPRERRRRLRAPPAAASRFSIDRGRAQAAPRSSAHDATCARVLGGRAASVPSAIASISGSRSSQRTSAKLRFEQVPQPPLGAVEVRLHRAHRHVQRLGEILVTHALHVVPVDQHLVLAPAAARSPSAADPSSPGRRTRDRRPPAGAAGDRPRPSSSDALASSGRSCDSTLIDDAIDPRRQLRLAAEVGQPLVHLQEHVLRQLLGAGAIRRCCARSAQRPGLCTDRPAPETRFHRPAGTARPARARGSPSFAVREIRAGSQGFVSPLKQSRQAASLISPVGRIGARCSLNLLFAAVFVLGMFAGVFIIFWAAPALAAARNAAPRADGDDRARPDSAGPPVVEHDAPGNTGATPRHARYRRHGRWPGLMTIIIAAGEAPEWASASAVRSPSLAALSSRADMLVRPKRLDPSRCCRRSIATAPVATHPAIPS